MPLSQPALLESTPVRRDDSTPAVDVEHLEPHVPGVGVDELVVLPFSLTSGRYPVAIAPHTPPLFGIAWAIRAQTKREDQHRGLRVA